MADVKQKETEAAAVALTFDQIKELLSANKPSDELATAILALTKAHTRGVRPQNAVNPGISEFSHPEGEAERPKAKLTRDTFFCGVKQSEEQLTPIEIDLFNSITVSKESRKGSWTATVEQSNRGGRGRLLVQIPSATADDMAGTFALSAILTELATGKDATDVGKLLTELAELQAKVAKMTPAAVA